MGAQELHSNRRGPPCKPPPFNGRKDEERSHSPGIYLTLLYTRANPVSSQLSLTVLDLFGIVYPILNHPKSTWHRIFLSSTRWGRKTSPVPRELGWSCRILWEIHNPQNLIGSHKTNGIYLATYIYQSNFTHENVGKYTIEPWIL